MPKETEVSKVISYALSEKWIPIALSNYQACVDHQELYVQSENSVCPKNCFMSSIQQEKH